MSQSIIDLHRDTLLETSVKLYDNKLTSRILLSSCIHQSSNISEFIEYLNNFIDICNKKYEKINITGILIILNKSIILLIECPIKIINLFLNELKEKLNDYNKNYVKYQNIINKEKEVNKDLKDAIPRSSLVFGSLVGKNSSVHVNHHASQSTNVNQSTNFNANPSNNTASISVNVSNSNNSLAINSSVNGTGGNNSIAPSVNSSHIGSVAPQSNLPNPNLVVNNPNLPTLVSPLLSSIRVLSFSEEVQRFCKYFSIRQLQNVPKPDNEDFKKTDPIILVSELLRTVLEVGKSLSTAEDAAAAQLIFSTGNLPPSSTKEGKGQPSIISKLPSCEQFITHLTGIESIMTSEEYLEIYTQPVHVVLESERVWPVEPYLKY